MTKKGDLSYFERELWTLKIQIVLIDSLIHPDNPGYMAKQAINPALPKIHGNPKIASALPNLTFLRFWGEIRKMKLLLCWYHTVKSKSDTDGLTINPDL